MQVVEQNVDALKEAHRRSAEKVQSLLEQLEAAEREFARLTDRLRASRQENRSAVPRTPRLQHPGTAGDGLIPDE